MQRNYYEAYDDRYRQIHTKNLQWFDDVPSDIVMDTILEFSLTPNHQFLEIGCGEGRDAFPLLKEGYSLLATDFSAEAISYCQNRHPDLSNHFQILDCITDTLEHRFDFIYAVAVVHMLVPDADRNAFYNFIRNHLHAGGIALICSMGDGAFERQTDIRTAFDVQDRIHEQTGQSVQIASTSCRMVSFETFNFELSRNGFSILKQGLTSVMPDFPQMMYAVVKTK